MSDSLSAEDLARTAADVLTGSPFPALVLAIPNERIVAASPAASELLDPSGGIVVGRLLQDFTSDRPIVGYHIFAGGRLNGFETFRVLRRPQGTDLKVRMWIRAFDNQPSEDFVVVVIVADISSPAGASRNNWQDAPAVVGTADEHLRIDRISSDAEDLFTAPVSELIDRPLLSLIARDDAQACLDALSDASENLHGITLHVRVRAEVEGPALKCELVILPLEPSPSCAFVFLPIPDEADNDPVADKLSAILHRLGRGAEEAQLARGVFRGIAEHELPGLSQLTTRELEVVTRLLDGDRPPAIAAKLFLSQSTVRNHLASVFAKLGVTSQQQLLDAFRN
jgi:DNA-binding CsgD family transcriptional regulator